MKLRYLIPLFLLVLFACEASEEIGGANTASTGVKTEAWWGTSSEDNTQPLDELPTRRNFLIVLDGSGSMDGDVCNGQGDKMSAAKRAIGAFVQSAGPDDNIGLIAFYSDGIRELVSLGSGNRDRLLEQANSVHSGGGTPLGDATGRGYARLQEQAQLQLGYGEYTLVIITDGDASDGSTLDRNVRYITNNSPVVVYSVGFCIGGGHALNQSGRTVYKEANSLDELRQGLQEVLAESESFQGASSFAN